MAKIHYEIHTPHGFISAKSDKEYTHVVYWATDHGIFSYMFCASPEEVKQVLKRDEDAHFMEIKRKVIYG